jgi:hypothetical protein
MATNTVFEPRYSNSWALVIGINQYVHAPPLDYARNDAIAVSTILIERFNFPRDNVALLTDTDATKVAILSKFFEFTSDKVESDDRIVVFFAGHGYTRTGARGEVGYLVPQDGDAENLGSLIRWDELTGNAELIRAKHIWFVMDACYGGLAVQRHLPPGSMRFAKDMVQRFSRQVLTAGKADETVADAGGPRAGHSVFTGHLLDGLDGAAAKPDGLLTANGVMAYVYDRVAKDYRSTQTPHFGFLDGDGDMILDLTPIEAIDDDDQIDKDILVEIPASIEPYTAKEAEQPLPEAIKEFLSDPRFKIKLHDAISAEVRKIIALTNEREFPVRGVAAPQEEFANRLRRYELADLAASVAILARWGEEEHRKTLEHVFARLPDTHSETDGLVVFLGLRWYPIMLLMYVAGIAALSAGSYENLASVLTAPVGKGYRGEITQPVVVPTVGGMLDVQRTDAFKHLPGHERHYVPRSEYLYKVVQPCVEDQLFLGRDYERLFDRFEVLLALVYADHMYDDRGDVWGPIGRFGWKYSSLGRSQNPFDEIIAEAEHKKADWGAIRAGLFNGSYERFEQIAGGYRDLLSQLNWF